MLRRGALLFPLLVIFAGVSLIRETTDGVLASVEANWTHWLAGKATAPASKELTLIEIDDSTLTRHVWPWTAADFALFFHAALPFNPSGLAVEPVLDSDRGALAAEDDGSMYTKVLHDGILRAPKLVLGGQLGWARESNAVADVQPMPVLRNVTGDLSALPDFTHVDAWAGEQFRLSTKPGWMNLPEASDSLGKCPLLFRYRGQPVPAITLQLAMDWARVTLDEVSIVLGSHIALGEKRIPIDTRGRMTVNFGAAFDRVEFDKLILSREQIEKGEAPEQSAGLFEKRVLFLGRTDSPGRNIETPRSVTIAPSEVFASALATIQTGAYLRRIGAWFEWTLVAIAAIASLWLPRGKATKIAIIIITAEIVYFASAWFVFGSTLTVIPGVLPITLALWLLLLRAVAKMTHRVIAF